MRKIYDPKQLRIFALRMVSKQQPGASATDLIRAAECLIRYINSGEIEVIQLTTIPKANT